MRKLLVSTIFVAGLAFSTNTTFAQTAETSVSYNKSNANGFVNNINGEKDAVATSLSEYFKKTFDSKSNSSKGYTLYKGVSWPEVSTDKLDVYYKVENKKGNNKVTMLVSKGYDNFISSVTDPQMAEAVKNFMNTIEQKAVVVSNANAVLAAQKAVEEAQKEYEKSIKTDEEYRKDKEKLEKKIAEQQKTIGDKEQKLNQAKAALEAAKAK